MPWQDTEDSIAGNLAFGHLARNLPIRLEVDGRVQVETLLAAAGAICGYCCQRAVLARGDAIDGHRLLTLQATNGHTYYAGDALNEMFYGGPGPAVDPNANLWNLLSGTAMANGLAAERRPTSAEIFAPMAATLGQADEGRPSTGEDHQPHLPIDQLLRLVWPLAYDCLAGRFAEIGGTAFPAPVHLWPAVTAWAAVQCFGKTLQVLDPRIGMLIVMQSAAFGSKLHKSRVEIPA